MSKPNIIPAGITTQVHDGKGAWTALQFHGDDCEARAKAAMQALHMHGRLVAMVAELRGQLDCIYFHGADTNPDKDPLLIKAAALLAEAKGE